MSDHGPISPEYTAMMNSLAMALDASFNGDAKAADRKNGFVLLVFPFGDHANGQDRINYISNAVRADMIVAMKEFIARCEGRHHEAELVQ